MLTIIKLAALGAVVLAVIQVRRAYVERRIRANERRFDRRFRMY